MDLHYEPLSSAHVGHLEDLVADPGVLRFTRVPEPPPPGFAVTWAARYEAGRRDGTSDGFAVLGADGGFLGLALAPSIDAEAREVELGYIVSAAARGRGVASAMLRHLTGWAFEVGGAVRAELLIDVENVASQRVAQRCDYVLEGVLRSLHLKQGIRTDMQVWSRLVTDE